VFPERFCSLSLVFLCGVFLGDFFEKNQRTVCTKTEQDPKLLFFAFTKVGCRVGFASVNTHTHTHLNTLKDETQQ
jgi:hypothetical protein|tara:strand:+ start:140 stop:364 length:225 start_codon:yes stop_codon:yes gene_type:complete